MNGKLTDPSENPAYADQFADGYRDAQADLCGGWECRSTDLTHVTAGYRDGYERAWAEAREPSVSEMAEAGPVQPKTLGEMTPDERQGAIQRAAARFQAELDAAAPAISAIMDAERCDAETPTRYCVLDAGHDGQHVDGIATWTDDSPQSFNPPTR